MEIQTVEKSGAVIIEITGEIDLYNVPDLKESIQKLISDQKFKVIINLAKVTYIDSSGIGALIFGLSSLKKHNGGMRIVHVSGSVRKVFELTKLTTFFEIYDSEEEALASFG